MSIDSGEKKGIVLTIEQQAEDIVRAMVAQSWNEEIETIAGLLRELTAARKVADAAVITVMAGNAAGRLGPSALGVGLLYEAADDPEAALWAAVDEYRALTETVEYVSHRLNSETAGGSGSHCSRCGEAVPGEVKNG